MTAAAAIVVVRAQAHDDRSACGSDRLPFTAAVGIAEDGGSTGAAEFLEAIEVLGHDSARRAYDDEWSKASADGLQ